MTFEDQREQVIHDAYMRMRDASCEEACEMIDALLHTDQATFMGALADWLVDFEIRLDSDKKEA